MGFLLKILGVTKQFAWRLYSLVLSDHIARRFRSGLVFTCVSGSSDSPDLKNRLPNESFLEIKCPCKAPLISKEASKIPLVHVTSIYIFIDFYSKWEANSMTPTGPGTPSHEIATAPWPSRAHEHHANLPDPGEISRAKGVSLGRRVFSDFEWLSLGTVEVVAMGEICFWVGLWVLGGWLIHQSVGVSFQAFCHHAAGIVLSANKTSAVEKQMASTSSALTHWTPLKQAKFRRKP